MLRFNFHWPPALNCDSLPERSDRINLCIEPPGEGDPLPADMDSDNPFPGHAPDSEDGLPPYIDWIHRFSLQPVDYGGALDPPDRRAGTQPGAAATPAWGQADTVCPGRYIHFRSDFNVINKPRELWEESGSGAVIRHYGKAV